MVKTTVIPAPDVSDLDMETSSLLDYAEHLEITSQRQHEAALDMLKKITIHERKIDAAFESPVSLAYKAHKALTALRGQFKEPLTTPKRLIGQKIVQYEQREAERAYAERLRLEAAARAQEEQLLQAALAAGHNVEAAEIDIPILHVAPAVAEVDGVTSRVTYRAEVVDILALAKYVVEHPDQAGLIEPNMPALNALARSLREEFAVPGARCIRDVSKAVRTV